MHFQSFFTRACDHHQNIEDIAACDGAFDWILVQLRRQFKREFAASTFTAFASNFNVGFLDHNEQ